MSRHKLVKELEKRFGEGSERLIDALERIGFGESRIKLEEPHPTVPGLVKVTEIQPTFENRIACLKTLLEYQQGKPTQDVNVRRDDSAGREWNADAYTLEELEALERQLARGRVIDVSAEPAPRLLPQS